MDGPNPANTMILPLFRRRQTDDTISSLYGMIVAQARLPAFYRDYAVPDTVDGRFELILIHLVLVLRRLAGEDEMLRALGQQVFDLFCKDMERNLREIGVSDLKVPKEMRRIGAAFYGRARAYETALADRSPQALDEAIIRNVYVGAAAAQRLAVYTRAAASQLAAQEPAVLRAGTVDFPDPTKFA